MNDELVPLWINVREDPWPVVPALRAHEWELMLSAERRTLSPGAHGFYVRSYVVSPDGLELLNDEEGFVRRVIPEWEPYLDMLRRAVERHKSARR